MKENCSTNAMLSAEGNSFLYWLFGGLFIKRKFCKHLFKANEMQPRDENGDVKWECSKCRKLFVAKYGLAILEHGTCDGQWGLPNKYLEKNDKQK